MASLTDSLEKTKRSADRPQSASSRLSLLLYHEGAPRVLQLVRNIPLVVGRKPPSDVVIEDAELSRQHARFVWEGAGVRVQDMGSTNGTFSGGERIEDVVLAVGDEVLFGSVTACVQAPTTAESMAPSVRGDLKSSDGRWVSTNELRCDVIVGASGGSTLHHRAADDGRQSAC